MPVSLQLRRFAVLIVFLFSLCLWLGVSALRAADPRVVSCNEFLVPKVEVKGKLIGQDDCRMIETDFTYQNRNFRRLDMGISGTLDGWVAKQGRYNTYFGTNPEFTYPQGGNKNPIFYGIGRYEADKGSALIFLYSLEPGAWNGKMFVSSHGAGRSFKTGTLKAWDRNLNPSKAGQNLRQK